MTLKYTVLRVFIASPNDLNEERKIFLKVIDEVNEIKGHSMGYHIEPLGWEDTLPGKGRPQELINKSILECDLFLMLLWRKWGTPTGKYSSGTQEEFILASELSKLYAKPDIWIFFKNANLLDDDKDSIAINDFRTNIEANKSFYYKTFSDGYEWEGMLRNHLCRWLDSLKINNTVFVTPTNELLFDITFIDNLEKSEIYFNISDEQSFAKWKSMNEDSKKHFMYNLLSRYLYLNLGVTPYKGIFRYKIDTNKLLLLGSVAFKYGSSYENSTYFIPDNYNQLFYKEYKERSLTDFHTGLARLNDK
ncbi:DUF4062 domain-containing protein [Ruminiclostridium josui]|uniref:DUF4062 domain-containing protein n=1 Tax=Ruminiclostridium josui TaxID=1499 RepID=UPI000467AA2B|nr:DUF4062 domain-containing protein [Ruminiclostridium josui]